MIAHRLAVVVLAAGLVVTGLPAAAHAATESNSRLTVRVQANAAKWVSSEVGGATVVVKDAVTGQVLQTGQVAGTSGDTAAIMSDPRTPLQSTPTLQGAASVSFAFNYSTPRRLIIEAFGPLVGPAPVSQATAQVWVAPGGNQDLAITLHGLIVTVVTPTPHTMPSGSGPVRIPITASVQMLCGCPISTTTPWLPTLYKVRAFVTGPGVVSQTVTLTYQSTDTFAGSVTLPGPGMYTINVVADMPGTGNTGSSATSVLIAP
ncbi:MAG: hypothetical protein WC005_09420 [Candidatus Nanopelagicales bacterium]